MKNSSGINDHKKNSFEKTEQALRKSEARWSAIFSKAPVGISEISLKDGSFIRVNDQLCSMLGRSREDLLSAGITEVTHPDDLDKSLTAFKHLLDTGEQISLDKRYIRPDGKWVWANSSLNRLYDEQGHPQSVLAVTVDLSNRMKTEEALRKSEERFRLVTNAVPQIIWIADATGKIEFLNQQWYNFTGASLTPFTATELVKEFIHPQEVKITLKNWKAARQSLSPFLVEHRIRSSTGEYRWFLVRAEPQLDAGSGKILRWFGTSTDIHDRKIAEEEAKLSRTQAEEAKKEAEKAARAKEDFLATMSHEIRTPLNGVLGIANLLLQQDPKEAQLENLRSLKFSAENLRVLINDILDFSKIQAGKVELEERPLLLKEFLSSIKTAHQPGAELKGIALDFSIDEKIPEVIQTDQLKLSQVLHNLVGNAVKFTPKGAIHVKVRHKSKKKSKKLWLDFSVEDTGIGIPQEKIEKVFDLFTQADNSTVREYGGTGLGLSISKMLLQIMGSHIKVKSKVGKGSCFFFSLPVKEGSTNAIPSREGFEKQEEQLDLSQLKVLLVEDVAINRMVIKQFLEGWWHIKPLEAVNGKESVEMARKELYDLVLMDVRMPVMDGYQATRAIRALPDYQQVPILALTADTIKELEKHSESSQFSDVIIKPIEPTDLRKKIIRYAPAAKVKRIPSAATDEIIKRDILENLLSGDQEDTKEFLVQALAEFQSLKTRFTSALQQKNEDEMHNLAHKASWLLDMLELEKLKDLFSYCKKMLKKKDTKEENLRKTQQQGEALIEQVISSLQEQLKSF